VEIFKVQYSLLLVEKGGKSVTNRYVVVDRLGVI